MTFGSAQFGLTDVRSYKVILKSKQLCKKLRVGFFLSRVNLGFTSTFGSTISNVWSSMGTGNSVLVSCLGSVLPGPLVLN